jgi:peptidoglycan hydrolase CwlO-like protein
MEDNNSFLIKTIAGALILILALNVYRTESTKKQMDRLAATVDSLSIRVGALEYPDFSDIGSGAVRNIDNKAVAEIAKGLTQLQSKVSVLQGKVDNISSNPSSGSNGTSAPAGSGKDVSDLAKSVSDLQSKVNSMQKTVDRLSGGQRQASTNTVSSSASSAQPSSGNKSSGRVSVTAKVKV